MTCKKRQVCNVCSAPFKMERGCFLEKRCPSCRFLNLQKSDDNPFYSLRLKTFVKENSNTKSLVFYDQEPALNTMLKGVSIDEYYDDLEDEVIKNELISQYIDRCSEHLNNRELLALREVIMKDNELRYVANILKVTTERARQIASSALKKIRHPRIIGELKRII